MGPDLLCFDWTDADASHAGILLWAPSWFAVSVVGVGNHPLLQVVDTAAPRPVTGALDLRADGLWTSVTREEADRWTVGLEAFAVAFDDPDEAVRSGRGDLVALGLDLEWEGQPDSEARVDGELLVGRSVVAFDAVSGRWSTDGGLTTAAPGATPVHRSPVVLTDRILDLGVFATADGWRWHEIWSADGP